MHFWRETRDLSGRDVRRIGHDDVKAALNRLEPVAGDQVHPISEAQRLRVLLRDVECISALVASDSKCIRKLVKQREKNAACTGAEIEDAKRRFAPAFALKNLQHR